MQNVYLLFFILQQFKAKKSDLFKACIEHCDILRYEFIFHKPCQSLDDELDKTFDRLKEQELISEDKVLYYCSLISLHWTIYAELTLPLFYLC